MDGRLRAYRSGETQSTCLYFAAAAAAAAPRAVIKAALKAALSAAVLASPTRRGIFSEMPDRISLNLRAKKSPS